MRTRFVGFCLASIVFILIASLFFLLLYDQKVVNIEAVGPFLFGTVAVLVGLAWVIDNRKRPLRVRTGGRTSYITLSPSSVRFLGLCFILMGLTEFVMSGVFSVENPICSIMIMFGGFVVVTLYELARRMVGWR
jgi:hypothetical protein